MDLQDSPSDTSVSRSWAPAPSCLSFGLAAGTDPQTCSWLQQALSYTWEDCYYKLPQMQAETSKLWENCRKRLASPLLGTVWVTGGRTRGTDECQRSRAEQVTQTTEETSPMTVFQKRILLGEKKKKKSIVRNNLYRRKRSTGSSEPCYSLPCRLVFIPAVRTQGTSALCSPLIQEILSSPHLLFSYVLVWEIGHVLARLVGNNNTWKRWQKGFSSWGQKCFLEWQGVP